MQEEVTGNMWRVKPAKDDGLVALYDMSPANVVKSASGQVHAPSSAAASSLQFTVPHSDEVEPCAAGGAECGSDCAGEPAVSVE